MKIKACQEEAIPIFVTASPKREFGIVGATPCVINVGTFERLNVGTFNVPAHDFGQTPREIAKGEWRKAKYGATQSFQFRNSQSAFRNLSGLPLQFFNSEFLLGGGYLVGSAATA
jgi:hypothetical protein